MKYINIAVLLLLSQLLLTGCGGHSSKKNVNTQTPSTQDEKKVDGALEKEQEGLIEQDESKKKELEDKKKKEDEEDQKDAQEQEELLNN